MQHLEIIAKIRGHAVDATYAVLCDFERYKQYSEAVRTINVTPVDERRIVSSWEVNFHRGILRWKEEDTFNPDMYSIAFKQLEGDADYFAGEWSVHNHDEGCLIRFIADFDLGIPGLKDIIEPIAEQALRDNIRSILSGLFSGSVEFLQPDLAQRVSS